ncbi:MAG: patatin-like phospholipase family protein [Alphaproteobacteria bacterium]|nr:patatin-like phospholipase family protein [Alphaproteobacteria bacterium]
MSYIVDDNGQVHPSNIRYLCLEGGGAKCIAQIGAIRVLESQNVLPTLNGPTLNPTQIDGVSASSGGALFALMLMFGYDAAAMEIVVKALARTQRAALSLIDAPQPGTRFCVTPSYPLQHQVTPTNATGWNTQPMKGTVKALAASLGPVLRGLAKHPVLDRLGKDLNGYYASLLSDWGFCTGLDLRRVLAWIVASSPAVQGAGALPGGRSLQTLPHVTFEELYRWTGLDLVLSGTNVDQGRAMLFRKDTTPEFPVLEAVAISMAFPIMFKPVLVSRMASSAYDGLWLDGGILNNLPLHAWDPQQAPPSTVPGETMHPGVLALRIMEGMPNAPAPPALSHTWSALPGTQKTRWQGLTDFLGALGGAVLSPAEEGQIRTPRERRQTLKLYAGPLSTMRFNAPDREIDAVIAMAERSTKDFFGIP